MLFLDTNAVIWLYQGEVDKFPVALRDKLEQSDLFVSPLVKLELAYLYELKRITKNSHKVIDYLYQTIGLVLHSVPLSLLIEESIKQSWTRDPFDRLIVSHAQLEKASLVTRDKTILQHYSKAIWA